MNAVIKSTGYVLVHTPDMIMQNGTTQTTERIVNPDSEYLRQLPSHIRSYEQALAYMPNQVYIGNMTPGELSKFPLPWYETPAETPARYGRFGEIMPENEFYLLMQVCDVFELVWLEENFVAETLEAFKKHPLMNEGIISRVNAGVPASEVENAIANDGAEPLLFNGKNVGFIKRAHDVDTNLSAHVMLENIVSKASNVLAVLHLIKNSGINPAEVEYVIDCAEEACGDMNQRGGGNFAKAVAEIAGLTGASGSDTRAFCAAPAHSVINAASLVKAGTYKNVIVCAGGCTAKLGMNGKDHVKKGMPILEDMIGGFAILISENDGVNPEIDTTICGRHTVGTGSSPQAVITSLVAEPLSRHNLKITDVDKYAAEMQNPDITKPAGAGDVPQANYKMIAALAVMRGEMERKEVASFGEKHGMPGWAPTQGHIPSGVPYLGFARQQILDGDISTAMIIGKGSLFLGRMTNLFDGVSFIVRKNEGKNEEPAVVSDDKIRSMIADAFRKFAGEMLIDRE